MYPYGMKQPHVYPEEEAGPARMAPRPSTRLARNRRKTRRFWKKKERGRAMREVKRASKKYHANWWSEKRAADLETAWAEYEKCFW